MTGYETRGASRLWWVFALRGALMALFGLLTLFVPGMTILVLVTLFGIYSIIDGVVALGFGFSHRKNGRAGSWFVQGAFMVLVGLFALLFPAAITAAVFIILGVWTLVVGAVITATSLRLRKAGASHWVWLLMLGILALIVGLIMVIQPVSTAVSFAWVLGVFALIGGIMLIVAGFRLKSRISGPTH